MYRFAKGPVANGESYYGAVIAVGESIKQPEGHKVTLDYRNSSYQLNGVNIYVTRLQSVRSNTGYQLKFSYAANSVSSSNADDWYRINKVTAINNAVEYCSPTADSCSLTQAWPYLAYAETASNGNTLETVTDVLGRQARFTTDGARRLRAVKRPGETSDGMVVAYDSDNRVDEVNWQNEYSRLYTWTTNANGELVSVSNDALNRKRTVTSKDGLVLSDMDALDRKTSYEYDDNFRLSSVTAQMGQKTEFERDARGRITRVSQLDKNGLDPIITSATYPALVGTSTVCANAITCDKPLTTTDARGYTTDFTYDQATGQVRTIARPAVGGLRPTMSYEYESKYGRRLDCSGNIETINGPISKLVKVSQCRVATTCVGSSEERVTILNYSHVDAPNLEPRYITTQAGDGTRRNTIGLDYDKLGNVKRRWLSNGSDEYFIYDDAGQAVGQISMDPDIAGSLPRLATKVIRNADGQVTTTYVGTTTGTTAADLNAMAISQEFRTAYDKFGRVSWKAQVSPTAATQYSLVQYGYDFAGRLECTALRMTAIAKYDPKPADACVQAGGTDRISRTIYDPSDSVTEVWSGIGTSLQQRTAQFSYNGNRQRYRIVDAKGNVTYYLIDDHSRPYQVAYPSKTSPGTVNWQDYEKVTYNPDGSIETYTTRARETFAFTYDALGRLTKKDVPDRTGLSTAHTRDVVYAYDLYGDLTSARFVYSGGPGTDFSYDGLGRMTGSTDWMKGVAGRTVGYEYDAAGHRTALVHPDGTRFTYEYERLDRVTLIRKNGGDLIRENRYLATGELDRNLSSGTSFASIFHYDGARRADQQEIMRTGDSYNLSHSWTFDQANQVANETKDNSLHLWDGQPPSLLQKSYAANGLNQYTQVDADAYTYDANGNLTFDGSHHYAYDTENRLVTVSGPQNNATLLYDPLGRLARVQNGSGQILRYNLYDGDALIGEFADDDTQLMRYVHGLSAGDDPVAMYVGSGTALTDLRLFYRDRLGSIVMKSDTSGSVKDIYTYDEFGVPGPQLPVRFGYTGQAWVPEAGLYYYKARMYSPSLGRFLQNDPIGYGDGLNMYRYVGNDPVNSVDPSGLDTIIVTGQGDPCRGYCVDPDSLSLILPEINFETLITRVFEELNRELNQAADDFEKDKIVQCTKDAALENKIDIALSGAGLTLLFTTGGTANALMGLALAGGSFGYNSANGEFGSAGLAAVSYIGAASEPQVALYELSGVNPGAWGTLASLGKSFAVADAVVTATKVVNDINTCLKK